MSGARWARHPAVLAAMKGGGVALPTGVYLSVRGESLGADDDVIEQWDDESGNDFHLTQANPARSPIVATVDGVRCADTRGSIKSLAGPLSDTGFGRCVVGMLVKTPASFTAGFNRYVFGPSIALTTLRTAIGVMADTDPVDKPWMGFRSAGTSLTKPTAADLGAWTEVVVDYNGASSRMTVGGVEVEASVTGTGFSGPRLGNYGAESSVWQWQGYIAECHVYRTDVYDDLIAYLQSRLP